MPLSRKLVYEALWTHPATSVAAALGISSAALAKGCRRRGIPTPPPGYWQRQRAGQDVPITPMADVDFEAELPWEITDRFRALLRLKKSGDGKALDVDATRVVSAGAEAKLDADASAADPAIESRGRDEFPSLAPWAPAVLQDAAELAVRAREIQMVEWFCDRVELAASTQPLSTGDVMLTWVHAVRQTLRQRDPLADVVGLCARIARGDKRVSWWIAPNHDHTPELRSSRRVSHPPRGASELRAEYE
jgi:hypothetical protein